MNTERIWGTVMKVVNSRHALMAAVASAALIAASPALADVISFQFNFVPFGTVTANSPGNTNDVTTATSITSGAPDGVTSVLPNNIGLVSGTTIDLTDPTPVTLGDTFTKVFTTALGKFTESLTVTSVSKGTNSLGITATGTVVETTFISGTPLDSAPVTYSAAYTQNNGPGTQINASFNDATVAVPGPVVGAGLPGLIAACSGLLALARRRRRQAA
jgi:hypothetical protein